MSAPRDDKTTVLVVDDDSAVREVVCRMLRRLGYGVVEASGGEEALAEVRDPAARIDLLLTDVVMPGMDGRRLSEEARSAQPDLPVLFMSGYTEDATLLAGTEESGLGFLAKPFELDALGRAVREALTGEDRTG